MNTTPSLRISLDLIVLVATIFGWWFVAIPLTIVGAWVFPRYVEIIFAGFLYDMLFSISNTGSMGIAGYAYLIGSVIILCVISYLKIVVKNNT